MASVPALSWRSGRFRLRRHLRAAGSCACIAVAALAGMAPAATGAEVEDLRNLSIEQLSQLEVTSVSKRREPLAQAAAAIFVITNEDIRRSGATSLPEVLRLAPNLEVARVSASSYSISSRGFNTVQASNKILVLIDGRSIYTPFHGGVFWDQQQPMLEDIERIEVISGPGGTLWGANAVNGVVNIITKSAAQTQGGLVSGFGGTNDGGLAVRFGGKVGANGAFRVYGQGFNRGNLVSAAGRDARDDFRQRQAGFRYDWSGTQDALTFEGDVYRNPFDRGGRNEGGSFLGRWTRHLGAGSDLGLQAYFDDDSRHSPGVRDSLRTWDVQLQHSFTIGAKHNFVWGGGYRHNVDGFTNTLNGFTVVPKSKSVSVGNAFVQDTIGLTDRLNLVLGTKLEYSSYTGLEYLPNARIGWQVADGHFVWAAVSRSVRTPTRVDRDLTFPNFFYRGVRFDSEKLVAYELGYRTQLTERASASVNLFFNQYNDLRVLIFDRKGHLTFGNAMRGNTYGAESWADWGIRDWWRLRPGLSLLKKDLRRKPESIPAALNQHVGNDPEYQAFLRSSMDLPGQLSLDFDVRGIDRLRMPRIPHYVAVDARLGWAVRKNLELWIAASDLFDRHHAESGDPGAIETVKRAFYAGARWSF